MYNMSEQQLVELSVQLWVSCGLLFTSHDVALFLCYIVGLKLFKLSVQLWVPCGLLSATCVALFLCYVVGLKLCASIVCYGWVEIILALFPGSHTPSFHYLQYEKQGGERESLVRFCA